MDVRLEAPGREEARESVDVTTSVVAVTVGLFVLHLVLQGKVTTPWLPDEAAYLGGADALAGRLAPVQQALPYYRWGYSALLAPVALLPLTPGREMFLVTVVNAGLLSSVFPLVRRLLVRAADAAPGVAGPAALIAALQPVVWVYGGFALAEPLLIALVPAWLLAVHDSYRTHRPTTALVVTSLALYATHERMVVLALPLAVVLVALARRPDADRGRILGGTATILGGAVAVNVVDVWMKAIRWDGVAHPQRSEGGVLGLLVHPTRWDDVLAHGVGHGWQLVASGGVPLVFGVMVGVRRSRQSGGEVWTAALLLLGGLTLMSVVFATLGGTRPDFLVYGRYAEVALPPVLGLGTLAIVRGRRSPVPAAAATAALVVVGAVVLAVLPAASSLTHRRVAVLHAPSLALFSSGWEPLPLVPVTVVTVALAGLVVLAAELRRSGAPSARLVLMTWLLVVGGLGLARSAVLLADTRAAHARAVIPPVEQPLAGP